MGLYFNENYYNLLILFFYFRVVKRKIYLLWNIELIMITFKLGHVDTSILELHCR